MFVDYYLILEVSESAETDLIKASYKRLAKKFHPDRNNGTDTTKQMQAINEAYYILKDQETRKRYHSEYLKFKTFSNIPTVQVNSNHNYQNKNSTSNSSHQTYTVKDEILKEKMEQARQRASEKREKIGKSILAFLLSVVSIYITFFLGPSPIMVIGSVLGPIYTVVWFIRYLDHH
jgi:curved DNA-binding protein CbpA